MANIEPLSHSPSSLDTVSVSPQYERGDGVVAYATCATLEIVDIEDFTKKSIFLDDFEANVTNIIVSYNREIFYTTDKCYLYCFLLKENILFKKHFLGFSPSSITYHNDEFYLLHDSLLYIYSIFTKEKKLLTDTAAFDRIECSPCGRGLMMYSIGKPIIFVYFLPFEREEMCCIKLNSPLVDIKWGISSYLSIITATSDGTIKIWQETCFSKEFHCVSSYFTQSRIKRISIAYPKDVYLRDPGFSSIKMRNGNIFPSVKEQQMTILASVEDENNLLILQYDNGPLLFLQAAISIPDEYNEIVLCDLYNSYYMNQYSQKMSLCSMTKDGIFFSALIVSKTVKFVKLYSSNFLNDGIRRIFVDNGIITEDKKGKLVNWTLHKSKGICNSFIRDNTITYNEQAKELPFDIIGFDKLDNCFVVFGENIVNVVIFGKKIKCFEVQNITERIKSVSIHSTDLFCVSTDNSIIVYFFNVYGYERACSRKGENQIAVFLRNTTVPTLLICKGNDASLHTFNDKEIFESNVKMKIPEFEHLVAADDCVVGGNDSFLAKFHINKDELSKCVPDESDYIQLTRYANAQKVETNNPIIQKAMKFLPEEVETLDICSRKFVYLFSLSKVVDIPSDVMQIVSIWGLFSPLQINLFNSLNIKSVNDLMKSFVYFWAKDRETLRSAVDSFVTCNLPSEKTEDIDLFVLLAIAAGKKAAAARALIKHGNNTLAQFIVSSKNEKREKTILKNAYAALKYHRHYLAAMFFVLNNMFDDALKSIESDLNVKYFVSRLLDHNVPCTNFFTLWSKGDKEQALDVLFHADASKFSLFSIEFIKCELMLKMEHPRRFSLLRLLKEPVLINEIMKDSKEAAEGTFCNSDIVIEEVKQQVEEETEEEERNEVIEFDFGGGFGSGNADDDVSDYSSSDVEEDSDDDKEEKFKVGYVLERKIEEICLVPSLFESNFVSSIMCHECKETNARIEPNDEEIASLLLKLFGSQTESISEKILEISKTFPRNIAVILVLCVCFVNEYITFINFLENDAIDDFIEIAYEDPLVTKKIKKIAFSEMTPNDENIVKFAVFSLIQQQIEKMINLSYTKTIAVIAMKYESLYRNIVTFSLSKKSNESSVELIFPSLIDAIKRAKFVRESEAFAQSMSDFEKTTFLLGSEQYTSSRLVRLTTSSEGGIKRVGLSYEMSKSAVIIIGGMVSLLSIPMNESQLIEFKNQIFDLLDFSEFNLINRKRAKAPNIPILWGRNITEQEITCVACHPISTFTVCGDKKGNNHLWCNKEHVCSMHESDSPITNIKFNQRGNKFAAVHDNGELYVNSFTEKSILIAKDAGNFTWINDDSQIAVISLDKQRIEIYDTYTGLEPIEVYKVEGTPSDKYPIARCKYTIAYGCIDGSIQLFDIRDGSYLNGVYIHSKPVVDITSDLAQDMFASTSEDGSVCLIHGNRWKSISILSIDQPGIVPTCITMTKQAIVVGDSHGIRCWLKEGVPIE